MKPGQPLFGIHLKSAVLCVELECSTLFDGRTATTCPRCASSVLQGILGYCNEPPVSNEWGDANHIVDLVRFIAEKDRAT